MTTYAVFGIKTEDIEEARQWVEAVIELPARSGHSEYYGKYYWFGQFVGETIEIKRSFIEDREETYPAEPNFPDWKFYLYVNGAPSGSRVLQAIKRDTNFVRLKEENV